MGWLSDAFSESTWERDMSIAAGNEVIEFEKHKKGRKYTYWYKPVDARWGTAWIRTRKEYDTIAEAIKEAGDWMVACFENGWPICIKVGEVP